ncbi:ABC transporter ATP-binding protein [Spirochaetota bacterium]
MKQNYYEPAISSTPATASLLEAEWLSAGYGPKLVVADASLQVQNGSILVILGPNGSGKTTLLKTCLGLIPALGGMAMLSGMPVSGLKPGARARLAAWVPQLGNSAWSYTARDIVSQGRYSILGPIKPYSQTDKEAVDKALLLMDSMAFADRPYSSLSGGEARRVLIARALAQETPLLVLDEPAAHLDPGRQMELMEILKNLAAAGKGVAVSLHDVNLAKRFADRVLLINRDGSSIFGKPDSVLSQERLEEAYDTSFVHGNHEAYGQFVLPLARKSKRG